MATISIIVPAYNVEKFINECLESVCNQTFTDLEIILINDGSTDKTPEICDSWARKDDRIRLFHQENKGLAQTRNIGVSLATSPYIGFVDSDDYIEQDMFEQLFSVLQKYNVDIVVCGVFIDHPHKTRKTDKGGRRKVSKREAMYKLLYDARWHSFCCNKLYKRGAWNGIPFPTGKLFEDFAVMHKVFDKGNLFAHTGSVLYHYRQHEQSIGHKASPKKAIDFFDLLCERTDFVAKHSLFSRYEKTQMILRLNKRMIKTFRELFQVTTPYECISEKEYMRNKIIELTGNENFTESSIKKELRKTLIQRVFAKIGIY